MLDTVISIENLSKRYLVGHRSADRERYTALRDVIARELHNFVRKATDFMRGKQIIQGDEVEEFWALKDVTFDVKQGEVVGIIGRNGAGKSTLLKILSRITEPTEGRIAIRGRVASLLEIGTGFHNELTGRENIFLNGAILGMAQKEIRKKFDEIVAFAEVERFLDTPVKRYSSGMHVRLAFSIAAHLEPEILVVDEVLAVGDAEFQKKCLGKMSDVAKSGRTILFVSHNHDAVRTLCTHGVVMRNGRASSKMNAQDAVDSYTSDRRITSALSWRRPHQPAKSGVYFDAIDVELRGSQPRLNLICTATIAAETASRRVFVAVGLLDKNSTPIMQALPRTEPFIGGKEGLSVVEIEIELPPLIPGTYQLDFWIGPHHTETSDYIREAIAFEIINSPSAGRVYPHSDQHGCVVPQSTAVIRENDRPLTLLAK